MGNFAEEYKQLDIEAGTAKELEELKKQFEALCDEQAALPRAGFAKVFEVLDEIDEAFTLDHVYTDNEENINKALEVTGHSNDETFCKAFKRNNQIIIEGKKIQKTILDKSAKSTQDETISLLMADGANVSMPAFVKMGTSSITNEWMFYPIRIFAHEQFIPIIDDIIESDAAEGKGLFANVTDVPVEDESLDEWFDIEAYGLKCSLEPFYRELQEYGILDSILKSDEIRKYFLYTLKNVLIEFIKNNTDKPNKVRNHISSIIKGLDSIPVFGLLIQILLLQGLWKWFEGINLEKGDTGYKEAQLLGNWISKLLIEKEIIFCYFQWRDGDKEYLKPFCNYLYITEAGKIVQSELRKIITDSTIPTSKEDSESQYSEVLQNIFLGDQTIIDKFFDRIKGKKGVRVVNEIIAIRGLKKMKEEDEISNRLLFDEISKVCPIGSLSAFNDAFALGNNNNTKYRRKAAIEEIKKAY